MTEVDPGPDGDSAPSRRTYLLAAAIACCPAVVVGVGLARVEAFDLEFLSVAVFLGLPSLGLLVCVPWFLWRAWTGVVMKRSGP